MFLYARIVLDNLKYMNTPDEIKSELRVLPANLDEAYVFPISILMRTRHV